MVAVCESTCGSVDFDEMDRLRHSHQVAQEENERLKDQLAEYATQLHLLSMPVRVGAMYSSKIYVLYRYPHSVIQNVRLSLRAAKFVVD